MTESDLRLDGPDRLPPGRHGLSREFVAHSQRERLLNGVVEAVAEHGYDAATISQVVAAAGVSRRAFYEHFADKAECFAEAYEVILAHLCHETAAAADSGDPWEERVHAQLAALLEVLAADASVARFFLIESLAAGGEVAVRHREAMQRFATLLRPEPADEPPPGSRPQARERALVGGIATLIVHRIEAGEAERLTELLPDLYELVLTPYLGREEARQLARESVAAAQPESPPQLPAEPS